MMIARLVFGLLMVASVLCFAMYVGTSDVRWRHRGLVIVKWSVVVLLGFFAVLILERVTAML
jgi:hypothetical protein